MHRRRPDALARRLRNGDPPDVWQTFAGRAVPAYAERGAVRDVSAVVDGTDLHPTVLRSLQRDGRPYGVPTGAHRGNVLWFNPAALAKAGIAAPFPGTGGGFLAVVDVFVAATRADNARNALEFLKVVGRPAVQTAFSRAKGSVPVVRDVDVSSLPAYQRAASADLWNLPVLMSVTHGQAMSPEFQEGFYDAVRAYVRTREPGAFADALDHAVARDRVPPR